MTDITVTRFLKKHNIEFNIEEISLDKNVDKSDIMSWMKAYQGSRRNMSDAERIYVEKKISERRLKEENEKKRLEGNYLGGKGGRYGSWRSFGRRLDQR